MSYQIADVRFNNGNGTVLCNLCSTMLVDHCDTSKQIDCVHLCKKCYDKLYNTLRLIANDYVELSHDKVLWQRNDFIKMAKRALENDDE